MDSQRSFRMMISYLKSLSPCRPLPPLPLFRGRLPGKGPSEGRGILVQDQQDPSAQLDGAVEGRLPGVLANLLLQLFLVVLVVGVGTHPVGRLIGQLAQRSVTLEARHELAHRLQPSMGDKPQELYVSELGAVKSQENSCQANYCICLFISML